MYAVGHVHLGAEGRRLAAVMACGPGAVLSHVSAAAHVNCPLDVPDHGHCEVDFFWPAYHLIVETDGWETHGTRAAFEHDRARDAALQAIGHRVVRFTRREVRDRPATVIRRLRATLRYSCVIASRNAASSGSSIE